MLMLNNTIGFIITNPDNIRYGETARSHLQAMLPKLACYCQLTEDFSYLAGLVHSTQRQFVGVTTEHLRAMSTLLESNREWCLILEDDVRPLLAYAHATDIIMNIPERADVVLFDWFWGRGVDKYVLQKRSVDSKPYIPIDSSINVFSAGCYLLSRKCAQWILDEYKLYYQRNHGELDAAYMFTHACIDSIWKKCSDRTASKQVMYLANTRPFIQRNLSSRNGPRPKHYEGDPLFDGFDAYYKL